MLNHKVIDGHILTIVQTSEVFEQSDLQKRLKDRGYDIPQATLSRRLKKLKIAKVSGVYQVVEFNQPNMPLVLSIKISEFGMIVLHTHPGNANSLGYFFDQKYVNYSSEDTKDSGILGTIAGDDTVVLILKSQKDVKKVIAIISKDFPYLMPS